MGTHKQFQLQPRKNNLNKIKTAVTFFFVFVTGGHLCEAEIVDLRI